MADKLFQEHEAARKAAEKKTADYNRNIADIGGKVSTDKGAKLKNCGTRIPSGPSKWKLPGGGRSTSARIGRESQGIIFCLPWGPIHLRPDRPGVSRRYLSPWGPGVSRCYLLRRLGRPGRR